MIKYVYNYFSEPVALLSAESNSLLSTLSSFDLTRLAAQAAQTCAMSKSLHVSTQCCLVCAIFC